MKLPFVEALETTPLHQVKAITPHLSFVSELEAQPIGGVRDRAYQMRTKAVFTIDQWAEEEQALPHLRRQAARVLMKEVYGPVEERLFAILTMLYEAGPMIDEKIAREVENLLNDLRPFK